MTYRWFAGASALLYLLFFPLHASDQPPAVVCLGDSITIGYGLDPEESYPALLQKKIEAAGLPHRVLNAGVSGDTTSGGLTRLEWILQQRVDVLLLALGGNDGLRGLNPSVIETNLNAIITQARKKNPQMKIILAGMQMPPNFGLPFTREFAAVFPRVAKEQKIALVPFLLEGVGGIPELNLADQIHPNAKGQEIIANNLWKKLEPFLREKG